VKNQQKLKDPAMFTLQRELLSKHGKAWLSRDGMPHTRLPENTKKRLEDAGVHNGACHKLG
jgi:hypothetical protein